MEQNFYNSALAAFWNWQFISGSVAIFALMRTLTKMLSIGAPSLLQKAWFKGFILTPMNLVLGMGMAAIPGFFYGERFSERMIIGFCAGFLNHFMYHMLKGALSKFVKEEKKEESTPVLPAPTGALPEPTGALPEPQPFPKETTKP